MGKSVTTWEWKAHLYAYYERHNKEKVKALDTVDWNVSCVSCSHCSPRLRGSYPGLVLW